MRSAFALGSVLYRQMTQIRPCTNIRFLRAMFNQISNGFVGVPSIRSYPIKKTLRDKLSQRMVERCNGMFLWVKMQEDNLRGGKSTKQLEQVVDDAPTGLEHLYDRNWTRLSNLPDYDRARAFSILRW